MNLQKTIAFVTLVLSSGSLQAQQLGGAAADGKFSPGGGGTTGGGGGLFSPNPYTGTCDINVPIYSFGGGEGNYGVSFSYNTKGVRVDEVASAVGLHWSLNVGGSIVRVVKDIPDELNIEADTTLVDESGWYETGNEAHINNFWKIKGRYNVNNEPSSTTGDANIYRDKEADDFIINLPTGSYTFNFGKNGNHFVHPAKNIKVELMVNGSVVNNINTMVIGESNTSNYIEFRVTDPQGNRFYFERSEYTSQQLNDMYGYNQAIAYYYLTSQWSLTRAELVGGNTIVYTLGSFSPLVAGYAGRTFSRLEGITRLTNHSPGAPSPALASSVKRVNSITYPNNVVVSFTYDTRLDGGGPALREVTVTSGGNCTRYELEQAYFYVLPGPDSNYELPWGATPSDANVSKNTRLKLKAIRQLSCDGTQKELLYSFDYNTAQRLPQRGSYHQDLFGYANSGDYSDPEAIATLVPYHTTIWATSPPKSYGNYRNASFTHMKSGILTKVTNGYGGSTEFFYGEHVMGTNPLTAPTTDFFMGVGANDGFRVDSIRESDTWHPGNAKVTVFQYSGGQRFIPGGKFHYPVATKTSNGDVEEIIFTSNYVTPHQLVQGANQGYSNVTIITKTGSGEQLSKRIIEFTNFKDASSGNIARYLIVGGGRHYYEFPYSDKRYIKDWEMGLVLNSTDYDENNRITEKVVNKFRFSLDTTSAVGNVENVRTSYTQDFTGVESYDGLRYHTDPYRPYTGTATLDTSITLKYVEDSRYIADTVWYSYDSHLNLKSTLTRNSEGVKVRTVNVYNYNLNPTLGAVASLNVNKLERLVATQRWLVGSTGFASDALIDANFSTFSYDLGVIRPKATFSLVNEWPISYSAYTGYTSGPEPAFPNDNILPAFSGGTVANYRKTADIVTADPKGNSLESQLNSQNQYVAMLWDTISGNKLAEATNCRQNDMAYTSFETNQPGPGGLLGVVRGNVSYNINQVVGSAGSIKPVSGGALYQLPAPATPGTSQTIQLTNDLAAGTEYLLTFWNRGGTPRVFFGSSTTAMTLPAPEYTSPDGWKFYKIRYTPTVAGKLKISGPATVVATYFDEIRLCPASAVMNSWTYEPLFGKNSETDASGRVTKYEYDKMGRLVIVRNQEGNVLSKTQYTLNGAE